MDSLVTATWGLVAVTFLLVAATVVQFFATRRQAQGAAERENRTLDLLATQTAALAASATANQAVADEMLAARKAANPLDLTLEKGELTPGTLHYRIRNQGERPVILATTELLRGQGDSLAWTSVKRERWSNVSLAPSGPGHYVYYEFEVGEGDLLKLVVQGRPQDGLEQSREFLFRIKPDRTLEDLWRAPQGDWGKLAAKGVDQVSTVA